MAIRNSQYNRSAINPQDAHNILSSAGQGGTLVTLDTIIIVCDSDHLSSAIESGGTVCGFWSTCGVG